MVVVIVVSNLVLVGAPATVHVSVVVVYILREDDDQVIGCGPLQIPCVPHGSLAVKPRSLKASMHEDMNLALSPVFEA